MLQDLDKRIAAVSTYDEYLALYRSLSESNRIDLFDPLWNLAIRESWDGRRAIASFFLVGIDPPAPRGCGELLNELANAAWDLSNKVVAFYLVTQFGRACVLHAIEKALGRGTDSAQKVKLEGVAYWARMPAADLVEPLHYFVWEEAIEGKAHDA